MIKVFIGIYFAFKAYTKPRGSKVNEHSRVRGIQMDTVTQQNAASTEETASASEELTAQAQSLMEQVKTLSLLVGRAGDGELHKSPLPPFDKGSSP
ncbi:MAG: hypothetical protein SCARUB_03617 [Candidatus Scalindua rubra]|uniref:Methyl-accepting chemotaxis protein n=1 Tax=Candidatus Scalindua rubra TaxID=1872076 RepID=A0A1E3X6R0_9BACT|nr:MAG: hypothetical protein SCARUB_03617 [Candidatus Scalindua rubra]